MLNRLELEEFVGKKIIGSYLWMFLGVLITFLTILYGLTNATLYSFSVTSYRMLLVLMLIMVFILSYAMYRLNSTMVMVTFLGYSFIIGIILIPVIASYEAYSVISIFGGSVAMFLGMGLYGYFTKSDLSSYSRYLFGALIGLIVAGLLNVFLIKSGPFDMILSLIGVLVFLIYVAYDTQRIKESIYSVYYSGNTEVLNKIQIIGAFSLYLDFINIFLNLLGLFGKRRD